MTAEEKEESGTKPKWICQRFFDDLKDGIERLARSHARASRETDKKIDDLKETMYKEINPMKLQINTMQIRLGFIVTTCSIVATTIVEIVMRVVFK
jgi:hypothetical protein